MAEQLDAQHIVHSVSPPGNAIMVPVSEVGRIRLMLARQGLPAGGSVGYEVFDKADGLTATQFQEQDEQFRALEGELARTIRAIAGIRAARVHLVLPHREPFEREQQEAQASIMLSMSGTARLDPEGMQAILNLVFAAVPGLRAHNIAVVDSRGDVLARAGEPDGQGAAAQSLEEVRHGIEQRLARAVEQMLEGTVGPGRVRAAAAVDLDVSQLRETKESYDPDGKVERSTQTVTDTTKSTEPQQTVSVQNNLPNADAERGRGRATSRSARRRRRITKSARRCARWCGTSRKSGGSASPCWWTGETDGPDGKPAYAPATGGAGPYRALVRGAIGFDEKRGDKVEIVDLPFGNAGDAARRNAAPVRSRHVAGGRGRQLAQAACSGCWRCSACCSCCAP